MRRVRRPLIALVVLVVAVLIGYAVRAARSDGQCVPRPTDRPAQVHMSAPAVP